MHTDAATLRQHFDCLSEDDKRFAGSLLNSYARYGSFTAKQAKWVGILADRAEKASRGVNTRPAAEDIGDLTAVVDLFSTAAQHLKHPAIVLQGPTGPIRLTVAGVRSKAPGAINVTSTGRFEEREWHGRISVDGQWTPARNANPELAGYLRRFAADPATVAGEHGRLTGVCCFCNRALDDPRSTEVGYGPICAGHYSLPWGNKQVAA